MTLLVAAAGPVVASAEEVAEASSGPSITVEPATARPGEVLTVRLTDWKSVAATVVVCGNLARRGSSDCDLRRGQGVPLVPTGGDASVQMIVDAPSVPCPCVVRAASGTFDEVALAPLEIVGAPSAQIVESAASGSLVSVDIHTERTSAGLWGATRAALGGPARYEVTVSVRNDSGGPLQEVRVAGTAERSGRTVGSFGIEPRPMQPGESFVERREVTIPAPSIGSVRWEAVASGAGAASRARDDTRSVPFALVVLTSLLVGDVAAIVGRRVRRRGVVVDVPVAPGAYRQRERSTAALARTSAP